MRLTEPKYKVHCRADCVSQTGSGPLARSPSLLAALLLLTDRNVVPSGTDGHCVQLTSWLALRQRERERLSPLSRYVRSSLYLAECEQCKPMQSYSTCYALQVTSDAVASGARRRSVAVFALTRTLTAPSWQLLGHRLRRKLQIESLRRGVCQPPSTLCQVTVVGGDANAPVFAVTTTKTAAAAMMQRSYLGVCRRHYQTKRPLACSPSYRRAPFSTKIDAKLMTAPAASPPEPPAREERALSCEHSAVRDSPRAPLITCRCLLCRSRSGRSSRSAEGLPACLPAWAHLNTAQLSSTALPAGSGELWLPSHFRQSARVGRQDRPNDR